MTLILLNSMYGYFYINPFYNTICFNPGNMNTEQLPKDYIHKPLIKNKNKIITSTYEGIN